MNATPRPAATIVALRHALHRAPELSENEIRTAATICERLADCAPTTLLNGLGAMATGVCAVYDSGKPGPSLLLRAELDALPIHEATDIPHCSTAPGVSHKCGHDGHMATLVAVAEDLHKRPVASGRVYLLFQPAEETGTGANAVLADPRFQALTAPDHVYAFHNVPKYPLGQVLVREGLFAQASTGFMIVLHGTTSHASYPEHGINPSHAVATLIEAVNNFHESLAASVRAPTLGTITHAELGARTTAPNFGTTPGEAVITGVLRAHSTVDLALISAALERIAHETATAAGLTCQLSWHERFAATESDAEGVARICEAAADCGLDVTHLPEPFRWSEDFGYFTDRFNGAFFGLGSGLSQPQLHESDYDYPDALIDIGARLYRAIIDGHAGTG